MPELYYNFDAGEPLGTPLESWSEWPSGLGLPDPGTDDGLFAWRGTPPAVALLPVKEAYAKHEDVWRPIWYAGTPPTPPATVVFSARTPTSLTASWAAFTPPSGADIIAIKVEYRPTDGGSATTLTLSPSAVSTSVTGLVPATRYRFHVWAVASDGQESNRLEGFTYTQATPPLAVSVGPNSAQDQYPVTWSPPAEGRFLAYRLRYIVGTSPSADPGSSGGSVVASSGPPVYLTIPDGQILAVRVFSLAPDGLQGQASALVRAYGTPATGPTITAARTRSAYGRLEVTISTPAGLTHVQARAVRGSTVLTGTSVAVSGSSALSVITGLTSVGGAVWTLQTRGHTAQGGWGPWQTKTTYTMLASTITVNADASNHWSPVFGGAWCAVESLGGVYQGYATGSSFLLRGFYFYGNNAISAAVAGREVLSMAVLMKRRDAYGVFAAIRASISRHALAADPGCVVGAAPGISAWELAVDDDTGAAATFTGLQQRWVRIPPAWHSVLASGSADGVGLFTTNGSQTMGMVSTLADPAQGRIRIRTTG